MRKTIITMAILAMATMGYANTQPTAKYLTINEKNMIVGMGIFMYGQGMLPLKSVKRMAEIACYEDMERQQEHIQKLLKDIYSLDKKTQEVLKTSGTKMCSSI